jgi:hypothetical protein
VTSKYTESDVAQEAMRHFTDDGWDCYPEVVLPYGGRADIVAVRPFPFMPHRKCVHIVECKTSWTLSLLEQAIDRMTFANYVTICAPTAEGKFYWSLCRQYGVGMLRFERQYKQFRYSVKLPLRVEPSRSTAPRPVRRKQYHHGRGFGFGPDELVASLDEDMKRYTPGSQSIDGFSSPWRRTMDRAAEFVAANPGCTVKDVLAGCEHHYANDSSAKQGFLVWLQKREDIEVRQEGRCLRFYPPGAMSVQPELIPDC